MYRRLYFVIPDEPQAAQLVVDLEATGVEHRDIHAIAGHGAALTMLPPATVRQQRDSAWRVEQALWNANMALFGLALAGLVVSFYWGFSVWSVLAAAVVTLTFIAGALFAIKVPDTHLDEFRGALAHGEIVLMIDVPKRRVAEIEELVQRRHPEATAGGVGWATQHLAI